jgi:hypothetical protein
LVKWQSDLLSGQLNSRVSNWLIGSAAVEFLIQWFIDLLPDWLT